MTEMLWTPSPVNAARDPPLVRQAVNKIAR